MIFLILDGVEKHDCVTDKTCLLKGAWSLITMPRSQSNFHEKSEMDSNFVVTEGLAGIARSSVLERLS